MQKAVVFLTVAIYQHFMLLQNFVEALCTGDRQRYTGCINDRKFKIFFVDQDVAKEGRLRSPADN